MLKKLWSTLRFRLAVWNAVVVLLTALVILAGLRQGVRWAILHEMDMILQEDALEVTLALQQIQSQDFEQITSEISRKATGHRRHGWFMQLLDENHHIIWASVNSPQPELIPAGTLQTLPHTVENYRLLLHEVPSNSNSVRFLCLGVSLEFLEQDMATIDRLVLLTLCCAMIAAPLIGYWLAARAARTIGEIIQTAQRLRPHHMEERLPVRGTGDELDQLSLTINGMLDRIAEYLEQKRDFLANSAHELRTPLAAIRSSVEVTLSRDRSLEEYQELLEEIIEQGTALELLVNQLLLISESESEHIQYDFQPVEFDQIIARSVDMFSGVAEQRNITIELKIDQHVSIQGNQQLLRQLVNNLIENAIKYTPAGGHIFVHLSTENSTGTAILCVRDSGMGIQEEDLPRVFDRFYRAEKSRSRHVANSGVGLGLSICKAVVYAHEGQIYCHSHPQKGSSFFVELPGLLTSLHTRE